MKRKIYFIAVLLMVGLLMPSFGWGNMFTERRSFFFAGHTEYFSTSWKYADGSGEYKTRDFTIDASNGDHFSLDVDKLRIQVGAALYL